MDLFCASNFVLGDLNVSMLKTLDKSNIKGKRILLRVAYDIALENETGEWRVSEDGRIRATLQTINYLLKNGCSIVLMSWLGRPKPGVVEDQYKMDAVAKRLEELLHVPVKKIDSTADEQAYAAATQLMPREILMVENTRFVVGEKEADADISRQMARLGEFVVYDAFAQSHRVHASTTGILENHQNTACAGFLMEKELKVLGQILKSPMEPFVVVLGGAKVSDKIAMIRNILDKAAVILVGGALANPFLKAKGYTIGSSLVESAFVDEAKGGVQSDAVEIARELMQKIKDDAVPHELIPQSLPKECEADLLKLQLPYDVVIAKKKADGVIDDSTIYIKKVGKGAGLCGADEAILDIGPMTQKVYSEIIKQGRTIFWNGPMGFSENFNFSFGTKEVAEAIAETKGFSILGGGDTESVISSLGLTEEYGHVSTGGGASLELLGGAELPVVKYLVE